MASHAIRSYSYDPERTELTVTFASDRSYIYSLVPPSVFAAFEAAGSQGAFHNKHIRERYPHRKGPLGGEAAAGLREAFRASALGGSRRS